jgi:hypothetical protein
MIMSNFRPTDHTGAKNGIEVVPEDINICTAVQEALGNRDFVNMADVNCECLSMASYYGDDSSYKNTFDGQVNQGVREYILDLIYDAETVSKHHPFSSFVVLTFAVPLQQRLCHLHQQSLGYKKSAFSCQRLDCY